MVSPVICSAISTARLIDSTAESRLTTIPLRNPLESAVPIPTTSSRSCPATSATITRTRVVPTSRPTTYGFSFGILLFLHYSRRERLLLHSILSNRGSREAYRYLGRMDHADEADPIEIFKNL